VRILVVGVVTGEDDGTGNPLSGGLVSALLAAAFGTALWRELRRRIAAPWLVVVPLGV
jgi:hypothetical protein